MGPNPLDPSSFNHRFVTVPSGHRYHLVDQAPEHWRGPVEQAPTVLLCHGFPDFWYGWRYQIVALASRGYRVICPSQLGYGETSKPGHPDPYSYKSVAYDMNGVLDAVGAGNVAVLGHDWGGMVAWRFAQYFPHRTLCLASACTPYMPPASSPSDRLLSTEALVRTKVPNFGYQLFFEREDTAGKIEDVLDQFLALNFSPTARAEAVKGGRKLPQMPVEEGGLEKSIAKQAERKRSGKARTPPQDPEYLYYLRTFEKHGLHAPLNWYRTRRVNYFEEQQSGLSHSFPAHIPALLFPAENDPALPPGMAKSQGKYFPGGNLRVEVIKGADHWLLQDGNCRNLVTDKLAAFVDEVLSGKWKPDSAPSKL
ncbi:alpha/beta hydrolase [Rhodotorula paludigena]|uniref:alpha/beta hydrolase n=1 Tax=Rhodotorula paludigena TaxID=86838 RepID=UPI003172CFD1